MLHLKGKSLCLSFQLPKKIITTLRPLHNSIVVGECWHCVQPIPYLYGHYKEVVFTWIICVMLESLYGALSSCIQLFYHSWIFLSKAWILVGLPQFQEDVENNLIYYLDIILQTDCAIVCCWEKWDVMLQLQITVLVITSCSISSSSRLSCLSEVQVHSYC